jgi:hypothetical protein
MPFQGRARCDRRPDAILRRPEFDGRLIWIKARIDRNRMIAASRWFLADS